MTERASWDQIKAARAERLSVDGLREGGPRPFGWLTRSGHCARHVASVRGSSPSVSARRSRPLRASRRAISRRACRPLTASRKLSAPSSR
jgi:hypothetical protein